MRTAVYWNLFKIAPPNTRVEDWAWRKYLDSLWQKPKRTIDQPTEDTTSYDPRTER